MTKLKRDARRTIAAGATRVFKAMIVSGNAYGRAVPLSPYAVGTTYAREQVQRTGSPDRIRTTST